MTVAEMRGQHTEWPHSRIPVWDDDPEDVVGVIYRREVLEALADGREDLKLSDIMRPVRFVLESVTLDNLLVQFLGSRMHLCVVLDEYGGVAGVVTLEDVLEEILGSEIVDETDKVVDMRQLARTQRDELTARRKAKRATRSNGAFGARNHNGEKFKQVVYAVALVLFLGGLGYLIFSGLTQDSVYFLNVSEALAEDRAQLGNARLFGKVSQENLEIVDGKLGADFDLIDKLEADKSLRVAFRGALPDTFKAGVEVIVEGKFSSGGETFVARTLGHQVSVQVRREEPGNGAGKGIAAW